MIQVSDLRREFNALREVNSAESLPRRYEIINMLQQMNGMKSLNKTKEVKMTTEQEMKNLKEQIKELQELTKENAVKEASNNTVKSKLSLNGLMVDTQGTKGAIFRDYSQEDFQTSKLKRLVR